MICKVKNTIEKYGMLQGVKSVAVGVSGGADSMCLLHILNSLKEEYSFTLKVVHVNHNLRGKEALRDENSVRAFCRRENIELFVFSEDIRSLSGKMSVSEEECGRIVRYECFEKADCDAVAVAHSLTDSIETLIFNLLRGTGTKGLCGIPAQREPNIIRPLIECTRDEIECYCRDNSIDFVTDSTNLTDDYTRNFIRHNIVKNFSRVNSAYEKSILSFMNIISSENDYIAAEADMLYKRSMTNGAYDLKLIRNAHPALRKRVISLILNEKMNKSVERKHIDLVDEIILSGKGQVEVGKDLYICADGDIISANLKKMHEDISPVVFKDGISRSGEYVYTVRQITEHEFNEASEDCFDAEKIVGELYLTGRMAGDKFTFKKRNVTKTLKKLFNELKIPEENRSEIRVIRDQENIVWVEGVGVNAPYLPDDTTNKYSEIKKEVQKNDKRY